MTLPLSASAQNVQAALAARGFALQVVELPQTRSARTSAQAAAAVGCTVGQIAKSLVFRAARSDRPVLVIASGANRVSESAVAALKNIKFRRGRVDVTLSEGQPLAIVEVKRSWDLSPDNRKPMT